MCDPRRYNPVRSGQTFREAIYGGCTMERNPGKPRLLHKDSIAEAFFSETGISRLPVDHLTGTADSTLAGMTTGEQAGVLFTAPHVRRELLSSLRGEKYARPDPQNQDGSSR